MHLKQIAEEMLVKQTLPKHLPSIVIDFRIRQGKIEETCTPHKTRELSEGTISQ